MIKTRITELLDIRHPIVLAPMDGVAGGHLAAAVSAAGAYGQIGAGYCDIEAMEREIALADGARVGIGFITFALEDEPDALDLALGARPPSIQLSFGDPRPWADEIHEAGALLFCGVQTPDEIERALEAGADVLVAQGRDAGGHGRPDIGTMALIPSIVDMADGTPVLAAGGITDGRGLAAALMLGADGIVMGTRFLASDEAISNPVEQAKLIELGLGDTVRSDFFDVVRGPAWPDGHDGRTYHNDLIRRWDADPIRPPQQIDEFRELYRASDPHDYEVRPLWAGEGVGLIDSTSSAEAVVDDVVTTAQRLLARAGSFLGGG